mmetsp:Transcript_16107/g.21829  ORF Transcript_16107/g.21829 Transcript_16107/m.21829 type:complete len:164 (+) Transcript_16107:1898-2389(+)|eukprot:CAMPEP_0185576766 /NCGR_PEP_ID=MMETSP0434-20130131/7622_1 /TAXON_ID=626734 ORGANISM="Favella taraikaensis, Strain Fe Narragansett Bay" /NCGR_SAMPLE_ID=MMETSP0434 /ASSEMBLY_ACC=CAM_ASM_000379 /LENGTH=163 /DNA_ID=CAMNT_0028194099 /DNA_START=1880 /DNA_END=2371 /DNA_ORIENTATION=+
MQGAANFSPLSPLFEEGKEDLEEAAPEEHHPKEEHLQQIGVSVTMPSHHVQSQRGSLLEQGRARQLQMQERRPGQAIRPPFANITTEEEDQNYSQEASQEDVFDEGEDVLNRRLPIVVNINGSVPNQRPSRIHRRDPDQANAMAPQTRQEFEPSAILAVKGTA